MNGDPGEILAQIQVKALEDEEYRQRLIAEPKELLEAEGFPLPEAVEEVVVVENAANTLYLVLPAPPEEALELDIEKVELPRMMPFTKF